MNDSSSPCPASHPLHFFLNDQEDEDTALVEYTTEFSAARYAGKAPSRLLNPPRRRPFPLPKRQSSASVEIFQEQEVERYEAPKVLEQKVPAARRPSDARILTEASTRSGKSTTTLQTVSEKANALNVAPKRPGRRVSAMLAAHLDVEKQKEKERKRKSLEEENAQETAETDNILLPHKRLINTETSVKPMQSNTVTSKQVTHKMSTRSAVRKSSEMPLKRAEAALQEKPASRNSTLQRSALAAKPVRPQAKKPLQPSGYHQVKAFSLDRHGAPTGKENFAPGQNSLAQKSSAVTVIYDNAPVKPMARKSDERQATRTVTKPVKSVHATSNTQRKRDTELLSETQWKIRADKAKAKEQADILRIESAQAAAEKLRRSSRSRSLRSSLRSTTSQDPNPTQFAKQISINAAAKALGLKTRKRNSDDISISTNDDFSFSDISIQSIRSSTSSDSSFNGGHESSKWGLRLKKRAKKSHSSSSEEFPILQEELKPEMYENKWLDAQESSMTQLLNQILESASPANTLAGRSLQQSLIKLYSAEPFPLIYKRLQASLLYGALVVPKELLDRNCKLSEDLGMKRRFLDIFVNSYSLATLKAGLEVVVGRSCGDDLKLVTIEKFLEKFLIRAEDSEGEWASTTSKEGGVKVWVEGEDMSERARVLRTTLLRCFMLVLLLDAGKQDGIISGCLFSISSNFKSSVEVLHALSKLLLPSFGDISRPLAHFNYRINHVQRVLDEYNYQITNLAVDLRDGVRLTRLVELLHLNEGTTLSSRLKYPAPSRPVRVSNVQVLFDYLTESDVDFGDVTAKDVVDGAREKTLGFLWVLVSRWGLAKVIDWQDLRRDVVRLSKRVKNTLDVNTLTHVEQLQAWSATVANIHGLSVHNLTSSFSDGKVFAAIVAEYEVYFPKHHESEGTSTLEEKLQALGCSKHFASMFSTDRKGITGHIFDENFVIAGLAFLCSRLLNWSVNARAASTIQHFYRSVQSRRILQQRLRLLIVSSHAANYVNTRKRVETAALVIQHAFRRSLQRRMDRFFAAVIGVQSLVRGMLARKRLWGGAFKRSQDEDELDEDEYFDGEEVGGGEEDEEEAMGNVTLEQTANMTLEDTMTDVWLVFGQGRG